MFSIVGQVKALLEEILERVTDEFNIQELMAKVEDRTPYIVVVFQECERMNILTREIQRSLRELDLSLKVGEVFGEKNFASWTILGREWQWGIWELESSFTAICRPKKVLVPETRVCSCFREGKKQDLEAQSCAGVGMNYNWLVSICELLGNYTLSDNQMKVLMPWCLLLT